VKEDNVDKIYVYFACFNDSEVCPTISNCILSADQPENLVFGIYFQYTKNYMRYAFKDFISQFDNEFRVDYEHITEDNIVDIIGLAKGRIKSYAMCQDEEYKMLIDGHMMFANGWDTKIKEKHKIADDRGITKPIINGYAGLYYFDDEGNRVPHFRKELTNLRYQYFVVDDENDIHQKMMRFNWHDRLPTHVMTDLNPNGDEIVPNVRFSGNFSFSRYNLVEHLPEWVIFEDEEMPWTINLFDAGFNFVFPLFDEPTIMHLYMGREPFDVQSTRDQIEFLYPDYQALQQQKYDNVSNYLDDPNNYDKIIKYQEYAKVKILSGKTIDRYVPNNFR